MGEISKKTLEQLQKEFTIAPQEALAEVPSSQKGFFIGIPKDTAFQERRIALTPNSVEDLVNNGHRIVIESGAGEASFFSDKEYTDVGAEIVYEKEKVYNAELILKVAPIIEKEIELMQNRQVIISPLIRTKISKKIIAKLITKKITALAFEYIKDDYDAFPFVRSMSEIGGNYAIHTAARYLSNDHGKGILLGSIAGHPPTKIVIIGAGGVGQAATKAALGFGATVQVFDSNISRLRRLQEVVGHKVYTSVLDPKALLQKLEKAHVVIGAMQPVNGRTPCVVTEDMVARMKDKSVIIDVSIDHGGCIETSEVTDHNNPVFTKHGVIHYCVPNIASNVSRSASYATSNILSPIIRQSAEYGTFDNFIKYNQGIRNGAYLYHGALCKYFLAKQFDLKFTDLHLLLSADY